MNKKALSENILFKQMSEKEITDSFVELNAKEKTYEKGEFIMNAGDVTDTMGLVISGSVTIESNDLWGNCTILSHVASGQFFAETYALLKEEVMLVDVRANEDCNILFLNLKNLLQNPESSSWKRKFITSLLLISSQKNLALSGRSFHTSPKSARGRILSYLNTVSLQKHSSEFDIPFNR
nr:cyclic nucleotide-binding domain-containing protein [Butyrivibrio sp.]